ncbi:MAG: hypothetical protein WC477_07725 [Patescibacteria group bacterium]
MSVMKPLKKSVCKVCVGKWGKEEESAWRAGKLAKLCPHFDAGLRTLESVGICFGHYSDSDVSCKICLIRTKCITAKPDSTDVTIEERDDGIPLWCPYATEHIVSSKR